MIFWRKLLTINHNDMKKKLLFLAAAVAALCLSGCKGAENKKTGDPDLTVLTLSEPTLTEIKSEQYDLSKLAKDENGFYILWNGENFEGWRGVCKDHVPAKWVIEDGALKFLGKSPEGAGLEGGDILFTHEFKNFEFEFEWKVAPKSNSGVFYLIKEYKSGNTLVGSPSTSPEYQILDNSAYPNKKASKTSSSLYDMIAAEPQNSKPCGEWNSGKIVVNNGKVSHFQNGVEVVRYELWTPEWEAMLRGCKWAPSEDPIAFICLLNVGGKSRSGYVGFQDHGDLVWYKNIKIREL